MKKLILTAGSFLFLANIAQSQVDWKIDNSHTKVGFSVTHMMVSETEGRFKVYDGKVNSKTDADFTNATIEFNVDVASVNTEDEKRDAHLKSEEFFNAEKFPKMTFKSTSMKKGKGKNEYIIVGDLTIRGVTKSVTLKAIHIGKNIKDPWGNTRTGFVIAGTINRTDFGLKWNAAIEAGGVAVSETVKINCQIEIMK